MKKMALILGVSLLVAGCGSTETRTTTVKSEVPVTSGIAIQGDRSTSAAGTSTTTQKQELSSTVESGIIVK